MANPPLGIVFHWIGGLAAASFYLPFQRVRGWSWETYWLVGGVFSWIIAPPLLAWALVPGAFSVLAHTSSGTLFWTFFFGLLWGIGGLTFGLTVRYLGVALGYALALGCCAAFGTLMPPVFNGTIGEIAHSNGGRITLLGVLVCLIGIAFSGLAGIGKEHELSAEQKQASVPEFNFARGLPIAVLCGIMSACMAFAFAAGKPIGESAKLRIARAGGNDVWQQLPILIVVFWGGFLINCIYCVYLHVKNRSAAEYIKAKPDAAVIPSLPANYLFSALAGLTWYFQFFFYSMGETKIGAYAFSSWTLHMASIIIFSTLWGIALKEWRGTSRKTHAWIAAGLATLVLSTLLVGLGNYVSSG